MKTCAIKIVDIKNPQNPNAIQKQAINPSNNEILGTLEAEYCGFGKHNYYKEKFIPFYAAYPNGDKSYVKAHIYAQNLFVYRSDRKKGVGTKLIQSLVKESADRGCEGRIVLLAGDKDVSPLPFYRKLGFATNNRRMNLKLDEVLKFRLELDKSIQEFMYLTREGIKRLLKAI